MSQYKRVYIGKIQKLTKQELYYIGIQFGTITDFLFKDTYAFIEYSNPQQAQFAIDNINSNNYNLYNGQKLTAEFAKEPKNDQDYFIKHPRIYIGRLLGVTRQQLVDIFQRFGEIIDLNFKNEYAFIEYNNTLSATKAVEQCNGMLFNQSKIVVQPARGSEEGKSQQEKVIIPNPPLNNTLGPTLQPSYSQSEQHSLASARLYVGKLNKAIKKQDLVRVFGVYGEIVDLLLRDDFAFIEFDQIQCAAKAMNELNGIRLNGQVLKIQEQKAKEKQPKKRIRPENQPFDNKYKNEEEKKQHQNSVLLSQSTQYLQQVYQNQVNNEQSNQQYQQLEQALNFYQQKYIEMKLAQNKKKSRSRSNSRSRSRSNSHNKKKSQKGHKKN